MDELHKSLRQVLIKLSAQIIHNLKRIKHANQTKNSPTLS